MDDADAAFEQIEQSLQMSVSYRKEELVACGVCWFCETELRQGVLFCDAGCAKDYERLQKIERITGR